jgi:hypothetical protein
MIDSVAEDMEGQVVVDSAYLQSGDDGKVAGPAVLNHLGSTLNRIVIGQGNGSKTLIGRHCR